MSGQYLCRRCGEVFRNPVIHSWRENHGCDIGWEVWNEMLCPVCGDDDIEEYTEDDDDA